MKVVEIRLEAVVYVGAAGGDAETRRLALVGKQTGCGVEYVGMQVGSGIEGASSGVLLSPRGGSDLIHHHHHRRRRPSFLSR